MENKECIEIICIVLTTIATLALVLVAFRQTAIQKTQTDIQDRALDIALIEQRLKLYSVVNRVSAYITEDTFQEGFIVACANPNASIEKINDLLELKMLFREQTFNSFILFDLETHKMLLEASKSFDDVVKLNLEYCFFLSKLIEERDQEVKVWSDNCLANNGNFNIEPPIKIIDYIEKSGIKEKIKAILDILTSVELRQRLTYYLNINGEYLKETENVEDK